VVLSDPTANNGWRGLRALLYFCACQIGAMVCAFNREDFTLIRRYKPFLLETLKYP
jgi:hypothetical protein